MKLENQWGPKTPKRTWRVIQTTFWFNPSVLKQYNHFWWWPEIQMVIHSRKKIQIIDQFMYTQSPNQICLHVNNILAYWCWCRNVTQHTRTKFDVIDVELGSVNVGLMFSFYIFGWSIPLSSGLLLSHDTSRVLTLIHWSLYISINITPTSLVLFDFKAFCYQASWENVTILRGGDFVWIFIFKHNFWNKLCKHEEHEDPLLT